MNKYHDMSDEDLFETGRKILADVARKAAHDDAVILHCSPPNGEMAALDFERGMDDYDSFDYYRDDSDFDDILAAAYMHGMNGVDIVKRLQLIEDEARQLSLSLVLSTL